MLNFLGLQLCTCFLWVFKEVSSLVYSVLLVFMPGLDILIIKEALMLREGN